MKSAILLLSALLAATGCAKRAVTLAEDPVERAATCGVVATAQARERSIAAVNKPLPIAVQGRILHYALLAASSGKSYEANTASAVAKRMPLIAESVTARKWKSLVEPCREAFPEAAKTPLALPGNPLTAALGCDGLAGFMRTALAQQDYALGTALNDYEALGRTLDSRNGQLLDQRGIVSLQAREDQKNVALATISKLGPPVAVLKLCIARYA